MNVSWRGVFPAATTHSHLDQSLDLKTTLQHLDAMLQAGIDGLIMLGSVGENTALEQQEKLDVLRATVEHVRGRVAVLSGVAEYTTALQALRVDPQKRCQATALQSSVPGVMPCQVRD